MKIHVDGKLDETLTKCVRRFEFRVVERDVILRFTFDGLDADYQFTDLAFTKSIGIEHDDFVRTTHTFSNYKVVRIAVSKDAPKYVDITLSPSSELFDPIACDVVYQPPNAIRHIDLTMKIMSDREAGLKIKGV